MHYKYVIVIFHADSDTSNINVFNTILRPEHLQRLFSSNFRQPIPECSTTGSFELSSVESRLGVQTTFSPKVTTFHLTNYRPRTSDSDSPRVTFLLESMREGEMNVVNQSLVPPLSVCFQGFCLGLSR